MIQPVIWALTPDCEIEAHEAGLDIFKRMWFTGGDRGMPTIQETLMGMRGRMAVAQFLSVPFTWGKDGENESHSLSPNIFVRTTLAANGGLVICNRHELDSIFVLVVALGNVLKICGWISGDEIEFRNTSAPGFNCAYYIKQENLFPMKLLKN